MTQEVRNYIRDCPVCQRQKIRRHKPYGEQLHSYSAPVSKWHDVSLDMITDLPLTAHGHDSILVVLCQLTHMCHLIPTHKSWEAERTAQLYITNIFRHHGLPRNIISDRDPRFTSAFWKTLWASTNTRLSMSSSHHPQSILARTIPRNV